MAIDVGCGTGLFTRKLAPFFGTVVGVDRSASQIEVANQNADEVPNVKYIQLVQNLALYTLMNYVRWLGQILCYYTCDKQVLWESASFFSARQLSHFRPHVA